MQVAAAFGRQPSPIYLGSVGSNRKADRKSSMREDVYLTLRKIPQGRRITMREGKDDASVTKREKR